MNHKSLKPYISQWTMKVNLDNAEHYQWGNACEGWHLLKEAGLSIIRERMPPGTEEVRHYHLQAEQFFFVLEGTLRIEMDDKSNMLHSKEGLHVPPKTPHHVRNTSDEAVEFLVVSAPPSHGDRVPA